MIVHNVPFSMLILPVSYLCLEGGYFYIYLFFYMFFIFEMEAQKGLPYPRLEQKYSAAGLCQLHQHWFFRCCDGNHQCQAMSEHCVELCGMESSRMTLPGNWISATYLFKIKFKALKALFNSSKYTISRERVMLFPCLKIWLVHNNSCGLNITITSKLWCTLQLRGQIHSFFFYSTLFSSVVQCISQRGKNWDRMKLNNQKKLAKINAHCSVYNLRKDIR